MTSDFTWRDAGRTLVFRRGGLAAAGDVLREQGVEEFELLSTPRALADTPELAAAAVAVHEVAPGQVPSAAAALLGAPSPPPNAGAGGGARPRGGRGGGRGVDGA
ncbi:MAG: hypothetical protein ACM3Q9_00350 [Methanosarcina sp.]